MLVSLCRFNRLLPEGPTLNYAFSYTNDRQRLK
jgi:hypothetical protein